MITRTFFSSVHRGCIRTRMRSRTAPSTYTAASLCDGDRGLHLNTSTVFNMSPRGRGVGRGSLDADVDADADDEGEAREGGNVGENKVLIRRGGDYLEDVAGGRGSVDYDRSEERRDLRI